jgi:hypothetical protein
VRVSTGSVGVRAPVYASSHVYADVRLEIVCVCVLCACLCVSVCVRVKALLGHDIIVRCAHRMHPDACSHNTVLCESARKGGAHLHYCAVPYSG